MFTVAGDVMAAACTCSCSLDYEAPEIYRSKMVTARKPHTCCECREPIAPGDTYETVTSLFDGYWYTAQTCSICVRIRDDFCPSGFIHGDLRETLWACLDLDYVTGEEGRHAI